MSIYLEITGKYFKTVILLPERDLLLMYRVSMINIIYGNLNCVPHVGFAFFSLAVNSRSNVNRCNIITTSVHSINKGK